MVTSPKDKRGSAFQLKLTGAVPSETIKFEIDSAAWKYTGGPHTASADGTVTATYQTALGGPTGNYNVTVPATWARQFELASPSSPRQPHLTPEGARTRGIDLSLDDGTISAARDGSDRRWRAEVRERAMRQIRSTELGDDRDTARCPKHRRSENAGDPF